MSQRFIPRLALLLAAAALLVWAIPLASSAVPAFVAGEVLFGVNLLLLVFVSRRLLAAVSGAPGAAGAASPSVFLAIVAKFALLGGGAYVALVSLNLRADFFIAGVGAGLGLLCLLLYLDGAKKRTVARSVN